MSPRASVYLRMNLDLPAAQLIPTAGWCKVFGGMPFLMAGCGITRGISDLCSSIDCEASFFTYADPATNVPIIGWLGSLVVRALDLQVDGHRFSSQPHQQILGWATVFGWAKHLSISSRHPG